MVGSYSPHSDAGGTLHLPSPTHIHHVDPAAAFKQLRRSLSRSPSKVPSFRLVTSKSASPSPSSPLSPSRASPPNRSNSVNALQPTFIASPSPLATPLPSSARKTRPARKVSPMRNSLRTASIQRSPRKRSLNESTNSGNVAPRSSAGSSDDQENVGVERSVSPVGRPLGSGFLKASAPPLHSPLPVPRATTRFEKGYGSWGAKSSPLKRSDGIMNFDQGNGGSPSAKRRSLHGGIFGPDFDIFDHTTAFDVAQDTPMTGTEPSNENGIHTDHLSPMPKRTSSLRRTTLQQRHDKPLFARSKLHTDTAHDLTTPGQHAPQKNRFRVSLDSALPPAPRDSPFSAHGGLPNASAHPMSQHGNSQNAASNPSQGSRHPLSRTISQSTSNSSMAEDSPTHIPIRQPEHRRPFVDFSKSLPMGAARPGSRDHEPLSQTSSGTSFATPENYKLVKPLPAAFMSTGLISKRHKHVDEAQPAFGASTSTMPDTPCKRHSLAEMPSPTAPPQEPFVKSHHIRHSFGTPSTPFNPHASPTSLGAFGKGVSVFGSNFGQRDLQRKASFLSNDGDFQSPPGQGDSQSSAEFDIPPTPTKQVLSSYSKQPSPFGESTHRPPHATLSFEGSAGTKVHAIQPEQHSSPLNEQLRHLSPQTPRESMHPPDPSGLSISNYGEEQHRPLNDITSSAAAYPPATPTAPRGSFASFGKSSASLTPSHAPASIEVDPVLTSRFDKVEVIGTGEFSQVYRVSKKQELRNSRSYFSLPMVRTSPKTPLPDRVWAVKKSRNAYIGPKDRRRKLQEVHTLKALGRADHTLELFDSWEDHSHLYIQTEFCEEGSLDGFLDQVGRSARLDDFRIWKVMLEIALGLKHIHDSGFIHLDLKPANVLITFEGVLKIADFGMATSWPAPPGIDGEGDREYIGPEILRGQFDKPADVFALGLIVLEIAANVMLPDNGASWQRLRAGDMSDVPSLTWSSETSNILRDSSGKPFSQNESVEDFYDSSSEENDFGSPKLLRQSRQRQMKNAPYQLHRSGELAQPPAFMVDQNDSEALDNIVRWMISPQAADRPVVDLVLATAGVQWAERRRRAGATIFEGNWGPADDVLADDAEMIDV